MILRGPHPPSDSDSCQDAKSLAMEFLGSSMGEGLSRSFGLQAIQSGHIDHTNIEIEFAPFGDRKFGHYSGNTAGENKISERDRGDPWGWSLMSLEKVQQFGAQSCRPESLRSAPTAQLAEKHPFPSTDPNPRALQPLVFFSSF